jgi:hypothetical protein
VTPAEFFAQGDWPEAAKYISPASNPLTREVRLLTVADVAEILASSEGENDESHWLVAMRLVDGSHAILDAWCDYTGWGCQEGGNCEWTSTLEELKAIGSDHDRQRLWPPEAG